MKYKLIATDFDDTLLNTLKEVSPKTKDTFLKCKKDFITVGVTARTLDSALSVVDKEMFHYLILNNGAYLYDVEKATGEYISCIEKETAIDIAKKMEPFTQKIDFCTARFYYRYNDKVISNVSFIKNIASLNEVPNNVARMNIFLKDYNKANDYNDLINKEYEDIHCFVMQDSTADFKWLVIRPKNLNKATTLEMLGKRNNIKLEEMVFFGDGPNDIEVMEKVGLGVAMGNALYSVKEKADCITKSNDEEGIKVFIEKYLKERIC